MIDNATAPNQLDYSHSFRKHGWIGLGIVLAFLGGLTLWATFTPVAGAVSATGIVKVEGNSKSVQHLTGGTVAEIKVKDGDSVKTGQVLVVLRDQSLETKTNGLHRKLDDALIKQARLQSELAKRAEVELPSGLSTPDDPAVQSTLQTQQELARANQATVASIVAQLEEQVKQLQHQIAGADGQHASIARRIEIAHAENQLRSAAEGQVAVPQASGASTPTTPAASKETGETSAANGELNRLRTDAELTDLQAQSSSLSAEISRLQGSIAERHFQIEQIYVQEDSRALQELEATQASISQIKEEIKTSATSLKEMEVVSPADGIVHESVVDTIGGVVGGGDTLMRVVPQQAKLDIELHVSPTDIDKVETTGTVMLRLPSFDPRTTPEIKASIGIVSPDTTTDPSTGAKFYRVQAEIAEEELQNLPSGIRLQPGLPVDTFIHTQERTVLSYLLSPLADQLTRAFRED